MAHSVMGTFRQSGDMQGHKKLYEEELVKEIMISTALCIQELVKEDKKISEEGICQFLEEHYLSIIEETLNAEMDEGEEPGFE